MNFDKILAKKRLRLLKRHGASMLLYLHIPYCDSKCHYCSFNSYVDRFDTRAAYMQAMHRQLEAELKRFGAEAESIESVFIGGGTPSTVAPELYAPLFETIMPFLTPEAEITSEANPNSASLRWLEDMKRLGVNRISFGVQSFNADKLRSLGRAHSPAQAVKALENAAVAGFSQISLDLIYNCRGDDRTLLKRDIELALSLPITHLSAYELTLEAGTPFADDPSVRLDDDSQARFVAERIVEGGFGQYEISNFGTPCRHNLGYWKLENYMGVGAGAVGFLEDRRFYPLRSIEAYLSDPLAYSVEELGAEELKTERLFLGLRCRSGIDSKILNCGEYERAMLLVREGKLRREAERFYNPDFFLADEIALYLLD